MRKDVTLNSVKKAIILFAFVLLGGMLKAQTTYDWLDTAPDGNWKQGAAGARWNPGGLWDQPPFGVLRFNNNNQLSMTNNVSGTYSQHKITFGSSNSSSRTISGNTVQLFDFSGTWPWIKNESSTLHTIGFPLIGPTGSINLELIASAGSLAFTNTIDNNGRNIQIYGNNTAIDATNRAIRLSGIVSGSGVLNVSQFGVVKLNTNHTYTGETQVDKGELWIETSDDAIASGSAIYLGNGGQLANVAKIFLSKSDGGATFSHAININNGNASTRFLGGVNTSGVNKFSSSIALTSSKPLNLEAVSSTGTVEFSGVISGDGAVTTLGAGTIKFSNANTYTGATTVTAGTLDLAANLASSPITVKNGAKLIITGTDVIINALTIESGGVVEVQAGKSLTVSGTLTNSAGVTGLVVKSGGSLIQNSAVSATVEREITGWTDAAHGWHFLSSPVAAQAINPAFTDLTATNYDFYAWWEPTNEWVNYKNTTVAPTWNTANVLGATIGNDNFIPGKGYLVSYSTAAAGTKQFKGTLNTANVSVSNLAISAGTNRGFYLLGNPFTSALTWGTGWSLTNINATAKVWKESTAAYVDVASGGIIPSLNGFMVEVATGFGGNNSLTIPTSARVHNNAIAWYKTSENSSIVLVANDPSGQTAQESKIRIVPEATGGFDTEFDSHFYPGFAPKFYSTIGNEQLSTNTLPDLPAESMIPFGFVKNDATNFSIELKESMEGYEVFLKDLKTNTDQNLTQNPVYTFTSESNDDANRFLLHFLSTVGTTEPSCPSSLRIYSNAGNIYLSGATGNADVYVRNMLGQTVMQRSVTGDALKMINAGNLTSGVYIVSVVNSGQTLSGKVIIK